MVRGQWRLTGRFKTAFPEGLVLDKKPVADTPALKESSSENSVILVADVDMLADGAAVDIQDVFGRKVVVPSNGNLALAMGMVHRVLTDADLESFTSEILSELCANAPLSIANTKTILEQYAKSVGTPDHARMRAAMERCARSEDYREGRRAFMEKRKPAFKGK